MRLINYAVLLISSTALLSSAFISCKGKSLPVRKAEQGDSIPGSTRNQYVAYDQSPMDMSYFPVDYPIVKMNKQDSNPPIARVIYSRPHKKNRAIFTSGTNGLCQYGKEWRLGANEATEIEFFRNVTIDGKNVPAGSYVIYCIPQQDKWTIVLNTNLHTWGLHMDTSKDLMRTEVPVKQQQSSLEDFTIVFVDAEYGADLLMAWDNVYTTLPIVFSK